MDDVSFWGVVALWLGLSVSLWWLFRHSRTNRHSKQVALAERARGQVDLAQKTFDTIRSASHASVVSPSSLEHETHALLQRVQKAGAFFDQVNALHARVQHIPEGAECTALAELLHIRRDLWAASEIVLMRDASMLGEEYADPKMLDALRAEAVAVLFKDNRTAGNADGDLIDLRLLLAREDADKFVAGVEARIEATREQDRLPTPREIAGIIAEAARSAPDRARIAWQQTKQLIAYVMEMARRIRESKGMVRGLAELRRAREVLPARIEAGAAGASALARRSAAQLKQHYEFLMTAHELQKRYAQGMRTGSEMSEQTRQFIARLDLAARSERLRLTSANAIEWTKRHIVVWVAQFIAALPRVQARLDEARAEMTQAAEARQAPPSVHRGQPENEADSRDKGPSA